MSFIEDIKNEAKKEIKTIVLPEATDLRVLEAAEKICKEGFAKVVLVGKTEEVTHLAERENIDISGAKLVDPAQSNDTERYADSLFEIRKYKGMTKEKAVKLLKDPVYFGMMMVSEGDADGLVSGASHSTADTLRPALQILKTSEGTKIVSAFVFMVVPGCDRGERGVFAFSDVALNQNPDSDQLSEIAISTAKSFKQLFNKEPKVAMLSYSTYGSATADETIKVREATMLVREKTPEICVDGEIQVDAAIVPSIANSKAPGSVLEGNANVLIFPNLEAGNIGYKLVERLAKAEAYGPICQGLAKPVNDLSRGCNSDDIAGTVAITALQCKTQ